MTVDLRPFLLITLLASAPALLRAEQSTPPADATGLGPPLTAEEFDARTQGKTVTYSIAGTPYGTEEYRPGHKVVWAFEGDDCREGDWFQQGPQICFDYHDETPLQCWTFHDTPGGLVALFEGDPAVQPLTSLSISEEPLNCPGPHLGV